MSGELHDDYVAWLEQHADIAEKLVNSLIDLEDGTCDSCTALGPCLACKLAEKLRKSIDTGNSSGFR